MLQSLGELDRHDSMELKVRESGLATKWRQVVAMGVNRFSPVATTCRPAGTIAA